MGAKKNKNKYRETTGQDMMDMIYGVFSSSPGKSFNYKQISSKLNITDPALRQMITKILNVLVGQGRLVEIYTGKYKLKDMVGFITGVVELTSKGYGFVKTDDMDEDVFISQANLKHALNGDKVKVYLYARKKAFHIEGEVTEILERAEQIFVGTIEVSKTFAFLVMESKKMPYDIFIPLDKLKGAKNGQKAIVKITDWPQKARNPFGEVTEVLGYAGNNETEMHAILAEFNLPNKFPQEVLDAAEKIKSKITQTDEMKRRDFRKITTFTIDPVDAKDFDDALSLQKLENGHWEVGVHIADVTHYVDEGTELDVEALERATSVYLVDRVVPMLPEKLSNFICSLRPDEEKLCFSAVFEMDENANILEEWFGKTIIKSCRRFSYEEAQEIIETGKGDLADELMVLDKLAKKLRADRFKSGAIAFDRVEVKFYLDEDSKPTGIFFKESKDSNKLIEEFMLLANKKVALFIGKTKGAKKTFVYRIHDEPNQEKVRSFSNFIKRFGYKLNTKSKIQTAHSMNQLLVEVAGTKEKNIIETLAVRTMAKAEYSTKNIGHYGLASSHYTHFTSPIRRYPDMLVHRLLHEYLKGGQSADVKQYEKMCTHSSEMEKRAEEAERASIKYKQVEFLKDRIGEQFDGMISGVAEWGVYVEITENKCEGLIPLRDMTDDFYIFDEDEYCIYGKHTGKRFQLGEEVKIEIVKANLAKKQLNFKLVED